MRSPLISAASRSSQAEQTGRGREPGCCLVGKGWRETSSGMPAAPPCPPASVPWLLWGPAPSPVSSAGKFLWWVFQPLVGAGLTLQRGAARREQGAGGDE